MELSVHQLDGIRHEQRVRAEVSRMQRWEQPHDASLFLNPVMVSRAVREAQIEIAREHARALQQHDPKRLERSL